MTTFADEENPTLEKDTWKKDFIRIDEIQVKCNFPIGPIKNLSIRERMGIHAVAEIAAGIERGSMDVAGQQFNSQPLLIETVKGGKKTLLFSGVISQIRIEREALYDTIHIIAYSLSWLMDLEKKNKSYQGDTSILELIQKLCKENSFSLFSTAEDRETKAPFIKYRETDWEFLVRLSTHLQVPVYAASDYTGQGIYLGLQESGENLIPNTLTEKYCMDPEHAKTVNFDRKKAIYYEVTTGQILHLGKSVHYKNQILWPFEINRILQYGMLYSTYKLAGAHYDTEPTCYNKYIKGVSLEGTVLERNKETMKIHLDIDKEQDIQRAYYYPWLPEHGNMVYCMPEEGSKIRLLIPGEDEREAIGIQCVRQNGNTCEETQMPMHRWFTTDENKKMTLQPSVMELSGENGKSAISFKDHEGSRISSSGDIVIQANGKIIMQGTKVSLNAPGEITVIKRELGDPAVVNICHNLDAMGKQTAFHNLEELTLRKISRGGKTEYSGQVLSEEAKKEKEEEKKKRQFELQKLLNEEREENSYELGDSIVKIISAIPQTAKQDRLSQIVAGFRPIAGRMKD